MSPDRSQQSDADATPRGGDALPQSLAPYRDERLSLPAENARLRDEIARLRRGRSWPTVAALVGYVVLVTQLSGWLNGTDPVRYWLAIVSLVVALGVGAASALHLILGARD
jgi:hypothetical protein